MPARSSGMRIALRRLLLAFAAFDTSPFARRYISVPSGTASF
ncbi:hypothetical protein [Sphingomonas aerophila]|uniref:Uncharacterized protein n=1 Tax=Sphingomonas aerophila TaxID=1344948 RepID=A0A7W9EST1_9SPHN|nr:hypothetical protein [Sphingomonas aerophila]MBB5713465.1 hypothetical protein [Sphingomonas aerophila]